MTISVILHFFVIPQGFLAHRIASGESRKYCQTVRDRFTWGHLCGDGDSRVLGYSMVIKGGKKDRQDHVG